MIIFALALIVLLIAVRVIPPKVWTGLLLTGSGLLVVLVLVAPHVEIVIK